MSFTAFSLCLVFLVLTLVLDLRASRVLRRGLATPATKGVLAVWPFQVGLHLGVFFLIASTPPRPIPAPPLPLSAHGALEPLSPAFPPRPLQEEPRGRVQQRERRGSGSQITRRPTEA